VTHAALNKDNGLVDPATGKTADPTTPRGMVGDNFAKAVAGAIEESRRQWQDFRSALATQYGEEDAALMACALTRDDPADDCRDRGRDRILVGVLALAVAAAVAMMLLRARHRRRA
jgi:hypothetical protein